MRNLLFTLTICAAMATVFSSCVESMGTAFFPTNDDIIGEPYQAPDPYQWWVLASPSATRGSASGMYLYEDGNGNILRRLSLPARSQEPHALEFDGTHLWLADPHPEVPLFKIDPNNGEVVASYPNPVGTGLAMANGNFYVAKPGVVEVTTPQGEVQRTIEIPGTNITDLAVKDNILFYATTRNSGWGQTTDLVRYNMETGLSKVLIGEQQEVWTMATMQNDWAFVNDFNNICRFESRYNEMVVDIPVPIDGDITSISGGPIQ